MPTFYLNQKEYQLISHYQDNEQLRLQLNELTQKTFGFTFEKWYQKGYWKSKCIPYSLMDNQTIVTHITVSLMSFSLQGKVVHYAQLGTVLVSEDYRHLGLAKALMNYVLAELESRCDGVFLYGNDRVVDFYPRFGFKEIKEYQAVMSVDERETTSIRRLKLDEETDLQLFKTILAFSQPISKVAMIDNDELVLFYCECMSEMEFFSNVLYLETMNTIVIAVYENQCLTIHDIFSSKPVDLKQIIRCLVTENTTKVKLSFTPLDENDFNYELVDTHDNHLFVLSRKPMINQTKMFPILSHT